MKGLLFSLSAMSFALTASADVRELASSTRFESRAAGPRCQGTAEGTPSLDLSKIDSTITAEFAIAWRRSNLGLGREEGLVLLFGAPNGSYVAVQQGRTGEHRQFTFTRECGMKAIVHTHPNRGPAEPSSQDKQVARQLGVPVATITSSGMFIYDPVEQRTAKVLDRLDWLRADNFLDRSIGREARDRGFDIRATQHVGARVGTELGSPRVCVHLLTRGSPAVSDILPVKAELARVWRLNGVTVLYPNAENREACDDRSSTSVAVFLVDRPETLQALTAVNISAEALAVTSLKGDDPGGRIVVFVGRVERLLESGNRLAGGGQSFLWLMIGRLIAHEVGHVLLRSRSHTPGGLMRRSYDYRDAYVRSDDAYRLTPEDYRIVHRDATSRAEHRPTLTSQDDQRR